MSTATKKKSMKGVRYTDAQKKEVTDFAEQYNKDNGRGGQSKAAEKFNVSPLTVATWMKSADKAPASSKSAAASNASNASNGDSSTETAKPVAMPSPAAGKSRAGSRYTPEQKKQVTDFVTNYNAENGRGGATQAIKKFGVASLTIAGWLKAAGMNGKVNKTAKAGKATKAAKKSVAAATTRAASASSSSDAGDHMSGKLKELLDVSNQIATAEAQLAKLQDRFAALKHSL